MSIQESDGGDDRRARHRKRLKAARNRRYWRNKKKRERLRKRLTDSDYEALMSAIKNQARSVGAPIFVSDYDGLIRVIAHHRKALGFPQRSFDQVTGLPDGYQGKLESGVKALGRVSMPLVLQALNLKIALVPDGPNRRRKC